MDVLRVNQLQMDKETCQENIVFWFFWIIVSCKRFIVPNIFAMASISIGLYFI
jgi:hypothetical protein